MNVAQIFTPLQVTMLRTAAEVTPHEARREAIKEVTELIKKQSPGLFFQDTKDGKPDPAMRHRVFFDEPRNLDFAEYKKYVVPYAGLEQAKIFKARG